MHRSSTPSFVLKLELNASLKDKNLIDKRFKICKSLYNAALNYLTKKLRGVWGDKDYRLILSELKDKEALKGMNETQRKAFKKKKSKALKEIEASYGYSFQDLLNYIGSIYKSHFKNNIGSVIVQKLCERAYDAVEKTHYGKAKKVNFLSLYRGDFSIEGRTNETNLRFIKNKLKWFNLEVPVKIDKNNSYVKEALESRIKFVRLKTETIRGTKRYFIELILEGIPPKKNRYYGALKSTVGLDIGPSSLAIVSNDCVDLINLKSDNLEKTQSKISRLQRKMDRSRRANNSNKFNENGTFKRGNTDSWKESNNYKKLKKSLSKQHRKLSINRKQSHEKLANDILILGLDIRVEKINFTSWHKRSKKTTVNKKNGKINKKKRFGKSILNCAPAMLLEIINRKLGYCNSSLKKINTTKCKASQYDHILNTFNKKELSERTHLAGGEIPIQRDIYSAFLIKNTMNDLESISQYKCKRDWKRFLNNYQIYLNRVA